MTYHSDFWIGVVTAGPVIALAHVIGIEKGFGSALRSLGRRRSGSSIASWLAGGAWPKATKRPKPSRRSVVRVRRAIFTALITLPYLIAAVGFLLTVVATGSALDSLRTERDAHSLGVVAGLIEWNLILLFVQVAASAIIGDRLTPLSASSGEKIHPLK